MDQKAHIFEKLTKIVGEENASIQKEILFSYARDSFSPLMGDLMPDYVVRPDNREQVQAIVRVAAEHKIPLQPMIHGTNCGGLALPCAGGILVDLRRMNRILEINEDSIAATIEPGVTWGELNREAKKKNLYVDKPMGPYTGSPVGSWCGWNMSIYFGSAPADKVLSLEVVLPNGEILRTGSAAHDPHDTLNPFFREAYGPDLTGLFRAAFGAFGIVTKMTIGLHPLFDVQTRLDFGFKDIGSTMKAMQGMARMNVQTFLRVNNNYLMTICSAPDFNRLESDRQEFRRVLGLFPQFLLSLGLNGTAEQVKLNSNILAEIAARNDGSSFDTAKLELTVKENMDDFLPGAGNRVRRMFAPHNTFYPILAWLPIDRIAAASQEAWKIEEEMGYRSGISGESMPGLEVYLWGPHGRTAFLEHLLSFDAENPQSIQLVAETNQKALEILRNKYGASCAIYYPGFSGPLNQEYESLLKAIKRYFDPQGIMSPGKLISGE